MGVMELVLSQNPKNHPYPPFWSSKVSAILALFAHMWFHQTLILAPIERIRGLQTRLNLTKDLIPNWEAKNPRTLCDPVHIPLYSQMVDYHIGWSPALVYFFNVECFPFQKWVCPHYKWASPHKKSFFLSCAFISFYRASSRIHSGIGNFVRREALT